MQSGTYVQCTAYKLTHCPTHCVCVCRARLRLELCTTSSLLPGQRMVPLKRGQG